MTQKVTVVGSYVVDLMARTPHMPEKGETVKGIFFKMGPGGKGFNQCIAAHKAGADVSLITKIGKDPFGKMALDMFNQLSIDSSSIIQSDTEQSGIAIIVVDQESSQNQIVVVPNACETISLDEIYNHESLITQSSFVIMQLEINLDVIKETIKICSENNIKIIFNPAPWQKIDDSFIKGIFLVCPNEVEASLLTGIQTNSIENAAKAALNLHEKGAENVVITLGGRGVILCEAGKITHFSAHQVPMLDTTGAGDSFIGALAASLSRGNSLTEAVQFANAAAALSVQKLGTSVAMPERQEIEDLLHRSTITIKSIPIGERTNYEKNNQ